MRAWIENQYGEVITDLKVINDDEFVLPDGVSADELIPAFFCKGDTYRVCTDED